VTNLNIEQANIEDIEQIAQIHVIGWQESYRDIINQDYLDSLDEEQKKEQWHEWLGKEKCQTLVARQDNKIIGFCSFGPLKTPPPGMSPIRPLYSSEIYAIYILPESWGKGVGTELMKAAVMELQTHKFNSLCLWVLEKNARANSFYKALGGQRVGKTFVEIGSQNVKEVCYGWRKSEDILHKI
jgi:GNAT superfamily N-acetyltransferase